MAKQELQFAKLFDLKDGNQVLATKDYDHEERLTAIMYQTVYSGQLVYALVCYKTQDGRDEAFEGIGMKEAKAIREHLVEVNS